MWKIEHRRSQVQKCFFPWSLTPGPEDGNIPLAETRPRLVAPLVIHTFTCSPSASFIYLFIHLLALQYKHYKSWGEKQVNIVNYSLGSWLDYWWLGKIKARHTNPSGWVLSVCCTCMCVCTWACLCVYSYPVGDGLVTDGWCGSCRFLFFFKHSWFWGIFLADFLFSLPLPLPLPPPFSLYHVYYINEWTETATGFQTQPKAKDINVSPD